MRSASFVVLGLGVLAACGPPQWRDAASGGAFAQPFALDTTPNVSQHYRAGQRIRPRWRVTPDGVRELVALHDHVLDLDCKFVPTVSGLRCVPDPEAEDGFSFTDTLLTYTDRECTHRVAWAVDLAHRRFVVAREFVRSECPGTPVRVYRAESPAAVTELFHRSPTTGKCGGRVSASDGFGVANVGVEITEELARGRLRVVTPAASDGRGIAVAYVESDDGAIAFDHWVDPRHDTRCSFRMAADGIVRCLPDAPVSVHFADGTCDAPGVSTQCVSPRFMLRRRDDCSDRIGVFRAGPQVPTRAFLRYDSGECSETVLHTAGEMTYPSAGEVAATEFVALDAATRAPARGGGKRLRANDVSVGAFQMTSATEMPWHDTKLDVDCLFTRAADGVLRCLPDRWLVIGATAFTDAECNVEAKGAYVRYTPSKTCGAPAASRSVAAAVRYLTTPIFPEAPPGESPLGVHTHVSDVRFCVEELGPWPAARPLYVRDGKRCTPMPAADRLGIQTTIGEVAPAAFEGSRETSD